MIDFNNIFDVSYKEQSQELFGFGKKKEPEPEPEYSLDEIKKSPKYNPDLPKKFLSEVKRAWNYQAYKLPKGFTEKDYKEFYGSSKYKEIYDKCHDEDWTPEDDKYIGFEDKIREMKGEELWAEEKIMKGKYWIWCYGIYEFAYGQPTSQELYWDVLGNIQDRWEERLKEKVEKLKPILSQHIPEIDIDAYVGTGDGDEGCVYVNAYIDIPTSYFMDTNNQ